MYIRYKYSYHKNISKEVRGAVFWAWHYELQLRDFSIDPAKWFSYASKAF